MAKKWHFQHGGFSMIELLFAMVLLTVIVMGVVKLQTSNLALSNTQNNGIQAHFLANQGVEIVKGIGTSACLCASPCKIGLSGGTYSLTSDSTPEPIGSIPFERFIEIDPAGLAPGCKVTAIVEWEDSTGKHTRYENGDPTKILNGHVEANLIVF